METEEFSLFNGGLKLQQPKHGYRVAIDPVFLAASIPEKKFKDSHILDMGCGIGTVGFCLLSRFKANITGIDIQPELIKIAKSNIKQGDNIKFICNDIKSYKTNNLYSAVVMNPPYMSNGTPAETIHKQLANTETKDTKFIDWSKSASTNLDKGGYLFLVHRADRLDGILSDLQASDFGSFSIFPLWSKANKEAKRIVITARKQKFAPLKLLPGLTLHDSQGYTEIVNKVLSHKGELNIL